jgi:hypothetical protein
MIEIIINLLIIRFPQKYILRTIAPERRRAQAFEEIHQVDDVQPVCVAISVGVPE